jgi:hypothetical protein
VSEVCAGEREKREERGDRREEIGERRGDRREERGEIIPRYQKWI